MSKKRKRKNSRTQLWEDEQIRAEKESQRALSVSRTTRVESPEYKAWKARQNADIRAAREVDFKRWKAAKSEKNKIWGDKRIDRNRSWK